MNDFQTNLRFRISGRVVETPGIDFSGRIEQHFSETPGFRVWVKLAGTCWAGRGMPRISVPPESWLVQVTGDRATVLEEVRGKSAATLARLVEKCKALETQLQDVPK